MRRGISRRQEPNNSWPFEICSSAIAMYVDPHDVVDRLAPMLITLAENKILPQSQPDNPGLSGKWLLNWCVYMHVCLCVFVCCDHRLHDSHSQSHRLLWSAYVIGQTIIFLPCGFFFFLSFFFSSPNLSRDRLNVCHISTHGVALVRI